jgi:hypothetical protein
LESLPTAHPLPSSRLRSDSGGVSVRVAACGYTRGGFFIDRCDIVPSHGDRKAVKGRKTGTGALALLEWAADRPKSWHPIGTLPETQQAAEMLAKRGVIEIRKAENQYRLKDRLSG